MTSEYLFSIFKTGNGFDYTSIVAGYFKSVELLLEYLVMNRVKEIDDTDTFENRDKCYWITSKHGQLKGIKKCLPEGITKGDVLCYDKKFKSTPQNADPDRHIMFIPSLQKYFNTTMQSLINCLYDNDFLCLSEDATTKIFSVLSRYTVECRNGHFHKDIIDDYNQVEIIRNNTILVLFLLLGSSSLQQDDIQVMSANSKDFQFSELYKAVNKIPRSVNKFVLEFDNSERINVRRLIEQDKPNYNQIGLYSDSTIAFCYEENYKGRSQTIEADLIVTKDNMPKRIWWQRLDGMAVEVKW